MMKNYKNNSEIDVLKIYSNQINNFSDFKKDEEIKLSIDAKNGDLEAQVKLLQSSLKYILRAAMSYASKNNLEVMDIVDEASIKLITIINKGHFNGKSKFSTYAYRVAINVGKDFKRKDKKRQNLENRTVSYELTDKKTKQPEELAEFGELENFVEKLESKIKESVKKYYFEGKSMMEIAIEQKLSVGIIHRRIHQGLSSLKEKYAEAN